jgi:transposase InsO family protein
MIIAPSLSLKEIRGGRSSVKWTRYAPDVIPLSVAEMDFPVATSVAQYLRPRRIAVTVGDGLDNAMMESFWSSMQIEMLNRENWKTRIELANAMFEYIEIFFNRQRRHSGLGYRTPIGYELTYENQTIPA